MTDSTSLVHTHGQRAFTTSLAIAQHCPVERKDKVTGERVSVTRSHPDVIRLIRRYQPMFETLGVLRFETRKPVGNTAGGRPEIYVNLNEDQATFLITLFDNTATVVNFKLRLVTEFRNALNTIAKNFADPPRHALLEDKRKSMWDMTSAVKLSRAERGKPTLSQHYARANLEVNWALTGVRAPLNEFDLTNTEVDILRKLRERNAALYLANLGKKARKKRLKQYANLLRAAPLLGTPSNV